MHLPRGSLQPRPPPSSLVALGLPSHEARSLEERTLNTAPNNTQFSLDPLEPRAITVLRLVCP
jgi:hypothetical protein